ncbi:MAG: phosphoribosyltransferase family protein [Candidatus Peribacteraceae bacterium]|nr:phosphoribosyltransferase family protein [Candidatus Peribacteraceae bacterium]
MHEQCGVIGVKRLDSSGNVLPETVRIAEGLQHRGELGAGMAWIQEGAMKIEKDNGLVCDVLSPDRLQGAHGASAIAHTRYATSGSRDASLAQPFLHEDIAFAFNGNIANYASVAAKLRAQGVELRTNVDTELIEHLLVQGIRLHTRENMQAVFGHLENILDGAYTIVLLEEDGTLHVYCDRHGFRKPCHALIEDHLVAVASEDAAIHDVWPDAATEEIGGGQLFTARGSATQLVHVVPAEPSACFFEDTYFKRRKSRGVTEAREQWGEQLAAMEHLFLEGAVVVPIPDSARIAARGFARASGRRMVEGIEKVRQGRTFIEGHPVMREEKAQLKYDLHPELLKGQKIILVDDSVVRGTTLTALVDRLWKEGGVKEIHVRIACPPVLAPCFYGMDFPEIRQLLARQNFNGTLQAGELPEEVLATIAARLKVNSIRFLPVESVPQVLARRCHGLCMACVNGEYPTPAGRVLYEVEERKARSLMQ